MTAISERLRDLYENWGFGPKGPLILSEAADTIDALVAALHAAADFVPEDARVTNGMIDAALALARKGGCDEV